MKNTGSRFSNEYAASDSSLALQRQQQENHLIYKKNLEKFTDVTEEKYPLVVLSSFDPGEIVELLEQRKQNYLNHIRQLLKEISEQLPIRHTMPSSDLYTNSLNTFSVDKEKMKALNGMICEECKGRCCFNGGDTALLQKETLRRYMNQNPELSAQQVLHNYEERVSHQTYADSCIHHTETGCHLPREMRADICNDFYCSTIKEFNMTFAKQETLPEGAIVISRTL